MKTLNAPGLARLVIYVLAALVGVAAVVANTLGYTDLGTLLGTVAGAGAAITGGTAAANLPKAPDQNRTGGFDVNELAPALQDIARAARTYHEAAAGEDHVIMGRHAARTPEEQPATSTLPTYNVPTTGA